jgi:hypothetical protein
LIFFDSSEPRCSWKKLTGRSSELVAFVLALVDPDEIDPSNPEESVFLMFHDAAVETDGSMVVFVTHPEDARSPESIRGGLQFFGFEGEEWNAPYPVP